MTSAWAFRKAISNLHFDLVVSKLLKITAALSWNWNMLAAPQNFKLKPYIFIPEENLRKERSHGGDCAFFFSRLLCSPSHTFCKAHSSAQPRTPGPRPMAKGPASRLARPGAGADGRTPPWPAGKGGGLRGWICVRSVGRSGRQGCVSTATRSDVVRPTLAA